MYHHLHLSCHLGVTSWTAQFLTVTKNDNILYWISRLPGSRRPDRTIRPPRRSQQWVPLTFPLESPLPFWRPLPLHPGKKVRWMGKCQMERHRVRTVQNIYMYRSPLKGRSQVARMLQASLAEVVSNSRNKSHQTWDRPYWGTLYISSLEFPPWMGTTIAFDVGRRCFCDIEKGCLERIVLGWDENFPFKLLGDKAIVYKPFIYSLGPHGNQGSLSPQESFQKSSFILLELSSQYELFRVTCE